MRKRKFWWVIFALTTLALVYALIGYRTKIFVIGVVASGESSRDAIRMMAESFPTSRKWASVSVCFSAAPPGRDPFEDAEPVAITYNFWLRRLSYGRGGKPNYFAYHVSPEEIQRVAARKGDFTDFPNHQILSW